MTSIATSQARNSKNFNWGHANERWDKQYF